MVLPIRDHGELLPGVLGDAVETLSRVAGDWELVAVDDGSSDDSVEAIRQAADGDPRVRILVQPGTFGRGAALRRGFDAARCLVILATAPEALGRLETTTELFGKLRDADLVTVRRPAPAGLAARWRWAVRSWLERRLVGVAARDAASPMKMMRASLLRMVALSSDGETIEVELLARAEAAGLRWTEVAVEGLEPPTHRPSLGDLWRLRKSL